LSNGNNITNSNKEFVKGVDEMSRENNTGMGVTKKRERENYILTKKDTMCLVEENEKNNISGRTIVSDEIVEMNNHGCKELDEIIISFLVAIDVLLNFYQATKKQLMMVNIIDTMEENRYLYHLKNLKAYLKEFQQIIREFDRIYLVLCPIL